MNIGTTSPRNPPSPLVAFEEFKEKSVSTVVNAWAGTLSRSGNVEGLELVFL